MAGFSDDEEADEEGSAELTAALRAELMQGAPQQSAADTHGDVLSPPREGGDDVNEEDSGSGSTWGGKVITAAEGASVPETGTQSGVQAGPASGGGWGRDPGRGSAEAAAEEGTGDESDEEESEAAAVDWEEREPAAVAACGAAAASWPRIIR